MSCSLFLYIATLVVSDAGALGFHIATGLDRQREQGKINEVHVSTSSIDR